MNEDFDWGQLSLQPDRSVPEKSVAVQAYLLECRLLRILREELLPLGYVHWHEATGLGQIELERALEDRAFSLDREQLQEALERYEVFGAVALVRYLHHGGEHG